MLDKIKYDGLDEGIQDMLSWQRHCQSEANMKASRALVSEQFAASGFVHYGKHYRSASTWGFPINEGLYAPPVNVSYANSLYMGSNGTGDGGLSKTKFAVTQIAGFISELHNINSDNKDLYSEIKFPEAPDGTVTYNKSTGKATKHADVATAFAAAATANDVEVVVNRVDMFGGEFFLEEANEVFPYGMIQSQAATIEGITTKASTRPSTYFAVFDGDTTSKGKCVVWSDLTNEQKTKLVSNPDHNLFLMDDGKLVQWRMRQRTIAGSGNGAWGSVNYNGSLTSFGSFQLWFSSSQRVKPQGYADSIPSSLAAHNDPAFGGSSYYVSCNDNSDSPSSYQGDKAICSNRGAVSRGVNGECYFHVWGVVPRLNQGGYHPSFNPMGARSFRNSGLIGAMWYAIDPSKLAKDTEACFKIGDSEGMAHPDSGHISSGTGGAKSGRPDGRFYDAIYASGQGGVIDYRLSAWDMSSKEEASKIFQKVVNGSYRGEELLVNTGFYGANDADGTKSTTIWFDFTDFPEGKTCNDVPVGSAVGGIRADGTGYFVGYVLKASGNTSLTLDRNAVRTSDKYLISFKADTSVSGNFSQVDVVGDPAKIVAIANLASGWQGGWIPVIPDGTLKDYQLTRKDVGGNPEGRKTGDSGASWVHDGLSGFDNTTNTNPATYRANEVIVVDYTAFAKQTKVSKNKAVLNGSEGVGYVYAIHTRGTSNPQFAESLLGKVLTSDGTNGISMQELTMTQTVMVGPNFTGSASNWGKLSWLDGHLKHAPVSLASPINDSPAVKALWHQTADNGQLGLNFAWNELKWKATMTLRTDTGAQMVRKWGERYLVNSPNSALHGRILIWDGTESNIVVDYTAYYLGLDNVVRSKSNDTASTLQLFSGNKWGDDSTLRITDGTKTFTNLNGDTCLYGTAELSIPYGYSKNHARAGGQVKSVDLRKACTHYAPVRPYKGFTKDQTEFKHV